jgi:hypothetical protein
MRVCRCEVLPQATLEAMRAASGASVMAQARTWLPATPAWQRTLHILWRRLWFTGRRCYRFVASRQASAITGFRMPVKST